MENPRIPTTGALWALLLVALRALACSAPPPLPGAPEAGLALAPADHLIERGEGHFARLWQVTGGGENSAPRWSPDGRWLAFQSFDLARGSECYRVVVQEVETGARRTVSPGQGVAGLGGYTADGSGLVFASTHATQERCPPPPDSSAGYLWSIDPAHDLYVADLGTGEVRPLAAGPGYDAEAAVSPVGDRIVFTSSRSGDVELWSCDLDGSNLVQLTDAPGYDGAASFSPDGTRLVFRSTAFAPGLEQEQLASYRELLARWTVAPAAMEIAVVEADGSRPRQVTRLGGANWTPCFFPDGERVLFSSNHHGEGDLPTNFDLFAVSLDDARVERITTFDRGPGRQFDGFPQFSPDGRFLAFASNRGGRELGETNIFVAEWQ